MKWKETPTNMQKTQEGAILSGKRQEVEIKKLKLLHFTQQVHYHVLHLDLYQYLFRIIHSLLSI